jgi:RNA polymerase sigma factor (sigma-70 family)
MWWQVRTRLHPEKNRFTSCRAFFFRYNDSMHPRRSQKGSTDRPVGLIQRVVAGQQTAWEEFVNTYCGFLYSLAWRYARVDVDLASELVLVALEGLKKPDAEGREFYRLRKYLDSLERFGSRSRFITWLALVTRNLFRDWFRDQEGRRVLPREMEGLDPLDQEIFRLVFWDGLSESEAFETWQGQKKNFTFKEFQNRLERIYSKLKDRNLLTIYQDLLRRLPSLPLDSSAIPGGSWSVQVSDPHPEARPDRALERTENQQTARKVGKILSAAILALPKVTRRVLLLHLFQGLSGEEVCRIMGFRKRQRVYDELAKAKRRIGSHLRKKGVDEEQASRCIGWLDGVLKKKES